MSSMFSFCTNLTKLDLSSFDTSNVTNMWDMFSRCSQLITLDLSSFDTSNVTNMRSMFSFCSHLEELDLSSFDTTEVTENREMFYGCSSLAKIVINNQNIFKLTNASAFTNTPIANGTGYVYVPDNLVESYKTATNWSTYANQIKPISELEET